MSININRLGLRIDGWADLMEDAVTDAENAQQLAMENMQGREMPGVEIEETEISAGLISARVRPYLLAQMENGATIIVHIGKFGKDLYASWDLYFRPKLERRTFILIGLLALLTNAPCGLTGVLGGLGSAFGGDNFGEFIGLFLTGTFGLLFVLCFAVLFGAIFWAFLVAVAGYFVKGSPLGFFIKELSEFDADDIAAFTLATHKSVLHALDEIGIDTETLRIKQQFKAGSQERVI